ncbi:aldehyde dehydrogenase family protein [Pelagibacterium xiamenense]|uniref:aldehyde dehydrogenase family protein n=1 Tax=Pelagibacterium xiamenense TaxID=2901140 RepID=UPI001E617119|nr:aldehyde dehydrogenase family protein [Pelagibacterium xiamenense]MCD7058858.1 aldehyde dehydrogenase family protein [Pelagibacterium xiamenense]
MANVAEIFETLDYGPAPESAAPALDWLDRHKRKFGHFIDGAFTKPSNTFASTNPANGEELAQISSAGKAEIDKAVKAARAAFKDWSALSGFERAKYLYAIARQIQKDSRMFAVLETLDNGKPIRETRDLDIPLVARHFYHHAGWAQHIGKAFPDHVPYGVCGQIIPWNFPLLMLAWKIAPALAAGNTVVLKPAEFTSLTALRFAEVCEKIGLPKGVVNIVTGAGETGEAIVNHPDIDKIAFTGSTEVGKIIRRATAGSGKGLSLELGGKSPFIVFEDADLDSAVEGLVDAIWFNQGQVCCAGSRLLVQESIEEKFIAKVKARMKTLRVGDPLDKSIDIGALVAPVQVERVRDLLKKGAKEGGEFYSPDGDLPEKGCYVAPTLVTGISPAHTLMSEEIFGPVLVAMSFRTPEEAVALANNTRYGLASSLWTENVNLALDIAPQIKAGVVWVNSTNQFDAAVGFGGYRESGFGREGGKEGMAVYLKPAWEKALKAAPEVKAPEEMTGSGLSALDRTAKLYIGGKQARGDSGYARTILAPDGRAIGEVPDGNRKDIRNGVEAARNALGWSKATAHNRAQILYYLGENLDYRKTEFADRLRQMTGASANAAKREVELSIERLFAFAGWADKYDGAVHNPPARMMAVAMVEPIGAMGIVAPAEAPLLGAVSLLAPAVAMGNTVVLVPSEPHPLAVTDLYQVMETSDVPGGVINIVTGDAPALAKVLAEHDGIDALWVAGSEATCAMVETASAGNVKQTWTTCGRAFDWADGDALGGDYLLAKATQVKNVWVPYGA